MPEEKPGKSLKENQLNGH